MELFLVQPGNCGISRWMSHPVNVLITVQLVQAFRQSHFPGIQFIAGMKGTAAFWGRCNQPCSWLPLAVIHRFPGVRSSSPSRPHGNKRLVFGDTEVVSPGGSPAQGKEEVLTVGRSDHLTVLHIPRRQIPAVTKGSGSGWDSGARRTVR